MTASDPRVGEIQARLSKISEGPWFAHRYYVGAGDDESDPDAEIAKTAFKPDAEFIAAAPADIAYLLAELRDRDEKLARVEAVADEFDALASDASYNKSEDVMETYLTAANLIRAAVAAANGGGE